MTQNTQLDGEVLDAEPKYTIAEYNPTAAALEELRGLYKGVIFQVDTVQGMKDAKESAKKLMKLRTGLEAKRKEIKEPALRRTQAIDAEARDITAQIKELEEPIVAQIDAEEKRQAEIAAEAARKEQERVDGIKGLIAEIVAAPAAMIGGTDQEIDDSLHMLKSLQVTSEEFAEFVTEAEAARDVSIAKLETMLEAAKATAAAEKKLADERAEMQRQREEMDRQKAEQDRELEELREFKRQQEAAKLAEQEAAKPAPDTRTMPLFEEETAPAAEVIDIAAIHPEHEAAEPIQINTLDVFDMLPDHLKPAGYWCNGEYWGTTPDGDGKAAEFVGQKLELTPFWTHQLNVVFDVTEGADGTIMTPSTALDLELLSRNSLDVRPA